MRQELMKTISSIQYSMQDGSVIFHNEPHIDLKDNKPEINSIMEDDLDIGIFLPPMDENIVKNAFLFVLSDFSNASYLTRLFCKNPYDCDYSKDEINNIKTAAMNAVNNFMRKLEELNK